MSLIYHDTEYSSSDDDMTDSHKTDVNGPDVPHETNIKKYLKCKINIIHQDQTGPKGH